MKSIKRGLAILLAGMLIISNIVPVLAEEKVVQETIVVDESVSDTENEVVPGDNSETVVEQQETEESEITENSDRNKELTESESEEDDSKKNETDGGQIGGEQTDEGNAESDENAADSEENVTDSESESGSEETDSEEAGSEETDSEDTNLEETDSGQIDSEEIETDEVLPEAEEASGSKEAVITEKVLFNTGNHVYSVVDKAAFDNGIGDGCFEQDGSYTINIPELNPFFPYEVQFTYNDKVSNQWFMAPDDSIEVGGHTFYVSASFDNTAVTQMSLNVAGDTVIVYPEEKEFTDGNGISALSLLPLEEKPLEVDLSAYTPAELTMVSVSSIFAGENALKDKDKLIWEYIYDDGDYTISSSGDTIDLSYRTYSSDYTRWEMIVGAADQLASDNTRYIVSLKLTESRHWLTPTVYIQDDDRNRTAISVDQDDSYYYDANSNDKDSRRQYIYVPSSEIGNMTQAYVSFTINPSAFPNTKFSDFKVYEGHYTTPADISGTDITNQLFNVDMTQADAGYLVTRGNNQWVTMVTYGAGDKVTGCLPFYIYFGINNSYISYYSLYEKTGSDTESVEYTRSSRSVDGCINYTVTLYAGYPANGTYYQRMVYYKDGNSSPSDVTAAYAENYSSIADAVSKGAQDIKASLFSTSSRDGGYGADYSKGVYFTIFIGEDGSENQVIYRYNITTIEGDNPKNSNTLSSSTLVYFYGINDSNENSIPAYVVDYDLDSYAEYNYLTMLVGENVNLDNVAPVFGTAEGINLYATGSSSPEVSGKSCHNFSDGPIQYTAASEDGKSSKNYWLQIVKASSGTGKLYVNSLKAEEAKTETRDNVVYSIREVVLDGYHDSRHDILLANMGTETIGGLFAELVSDTLELDDYWTLNGEYGLSGFKGVYNETYVSYGELPNLAMIRLKAKSSTAAGTDVSGTLTIKSGSTTLMVLTLTGTVGNPCITTKEIPQAVKYVPYGTMIQNNNKYDWNKTSYSTTSGTLPDGMEVKPNGEIYGVPKEAGEFTFTVRMTNSYSSFSSSSMTYTLTVLENTDPNVDAANDEGYQLKERVPDITMSDNDSHTLVSEGEYTQFVDVYLDGEKLVSGTDYESESGSTRITIKGETLAKSKGSHTIGVEFRDGDDALKRSAQNYNVGGGNSSDSGSGSGSGSTGSGSNGSGSSGSGNNGSSDNSESTYDGNSSTNNETIGSANSGNNKNGSNGLMQVSLDGGEVTTIVYTIEPGDTLWKIAEKFYGSGAYWSKIFADNADTISDPDRIYVGQTINIYLTQSSAAAAVGDGGTYYTISAGDNLWKIAQEFYGRGQYWERIYQANEDIIADPKRIYAGQVIFVPEM